MVEREFGFSIDWLENEIDAIIIGDIGILEIIKDLDMKTPLYASTYFASMNNETIEFLRKLGEAPEKDRICQTLRYAFLRMRSGRTWIPSQRRYPILRHSISSEEYYCALFKAF
jgi:hypothetical protein